MEGCEHFCLCHSSGPPEGCSIHYWPAVLQSVRSVSPEVTEERGLLSADLRLCRWSSDSSSESESWDIVGLLEACCGVWHTRYISLCGLLLIWLGLCEHLWGLYVAAAVDAVAAADQDDCLLG